MTENVANVTGPFSSVQRRMFGCGTTAGKWTIDGLRLMPMMIRTALHHSSAAETAEADGPSVADTGRRWESPLRRARRRPQLVIRRRGTFRQTTSLATLIRSLPTCDARLD